MKINEIICETLEHNDFQRIQETDYYVKQDITPTQDIVDACFHSFSNVLGDDSVPNNIKNSVIDLQNQFYKHAKRHGLQVPDNEDIFTGSIRGYGK